jgi:predicted AlkP superfamily phosphohydrolase/phosphomutase
MKRRVLVIGLDSAPLSLMVPWVSQGRLPNFAKIFRSGARGDLYSAIPVTPVAWSTIYTGTNPGRHGILGFKNHESGTYFDHAVNSTMRNGRDVWEVAGSHGRRAVVVNAPLTYPPRSINGSLVCGFMAPGTEHEFTYPESLGDELKAAIPGYRIGTAPTYLRGLYLRELIRTVEMVGEAAVMLLKKSDWDLAFVVFKETDEVQHSFFDRPGAMLRLYQAVDVIVGELLGLAGDSAYTLVVSDHGGERFEKRFNVAALLQRSGYVSVRTGKRRVSTALFHNAAKVVSAARLQWLLDVPGSRRLMQGLVRARVSSLGPDSDSFYGGQIDWGKTTAFISSGVGIRLNMKGREPEGLIDPDDYERVRARIAGQLSGLRDPENGRTVFRYALPREKVLSGPHVPDAPDIMCLPDTGYLPTESLASFDPLALTSSKGSLFSRTSPWSGTHSPLGVVVVSGPGTQGSAIENARLEDIAPTILYAMGLPVPQGLDGRILLEAFSGEHRKSNPVEWEESAAQTFVAPRQLPAEEERKIEERLKQLGYLS